MWADTLAPFELLEWNEKYKFFPSPEDDDDAVKNVESIADVVKRTLSNDLEQHLNGENGREYNVTKLNRQSQLLGL